jgi:hypothetical protein
LFLLLSSRKAIRFEAQHHGDVCKKRADPQQSATINQKKLQYLAQKTAQKNTALDYAGASTDEVYWLPIQ